MSRPWSERFWEKVDAGDCWLWTAATDLNGYGTFAPVGNRHRKAHRLSWELLVGPIPDGLELDHLCRVPACVNPDHLEPVTHAENMRRGHHPSGPNHYQAAKIACPYGHPYSGNNLYLAGGRRHCRACKSARSAAAEVIRKEQRTRRRLELAA